MELSEAVSLLGNWSREEIKTAITDGIALPRDGRVVRLRATPVGRDFDVDEADLDAFIREWDGVEPGRHPPVAVRRELLVEAGHRCAICEDSAPFQYHHIVEFSTVPHYDVRHMLAICGTCHHKCTVGIIDRIAQQVYKAKLARGNGAVAGNGDQPTYLNHDGPARFSWEDLRDVVTALHTGLNAAANPGESQFDFSDVDLAEKNRLNELSEDYFREMRAAHEPYFGRVRAFLELPANAPFRDRYFEVVDELRMKIAADRARFGGFEHILTRFADIAVQNNPDALRGKRRALNILLSFMYFNCDIGRKT